MSYSKFNIYNQDTLINDSLIDEIEKSLNMYGSNFTYIKSSEQTSNSFAKYMVEGEIEIQPNFSDTDITYLENFFENNMFDNILSSDNIFEDYIREQEPSPVYCFRPSIHDTLDNILLEIKDSKKVIQNNCLVDLGYDSAYCSVYLYKGTSGNLYLFLVDFNIREYYLV